MPKNVLSDQGNPPDQKQEKDLLDDSAAAYHEALLDCSPDHIDTALLEKFEQAIYKDTASFQHHSLSRIAREYDPIDLAKTSARLPMKARVFVFRNLPDLDAKTAFIIHTGSRTRYAIYRSLHDREIKDIFENMPPDEAVCVLEEVPARRLRRIFELLDDKKARKIIALQQHRVQTAGRLMTNEFFAFPLTKTIKEAVSAIRDHPGVEFVQTIFVLGHDLELLGQISDRELLVNNTAMPLQKIMKPVLHRVSPETSREEVVDFFERYHISCLPVVDQQDCLIGVITATDAIEMMEEIANATIASIGGTTEETTSDEPTWHRFKARAPWLVITLLAGMLTAIGFSIFQKEPWFLAVPFFTPLITGMSGNVGIQCSTVLIRSMATGEVSSKTAGGIISRELKIGTLIGVCFGILCGLGAYVINKTGLQQIFIEPMLVAIMVFSGVLGGCFTASVLGTFSPLFFHRYRIDPAVASGPIVTACNDVLSTYMYFFVAWVIGTFFVFLGWGQPLIY